MTVAPSFPPFPMFAHTDIAADLDFSSAELLALLELASDVKRSPERYRSALAGKSIALLFEKPSLRTRMTFELAIQQLGGFAVVNEAMIGAREPIRDIARNLDRWFSGIVARTFKQETVDELARWSRVPVVNALSDVYHPCQALADMQTLREHFGATKGLKLAFIGDGNNMAHSLMLDAPRLGMDFALATPKNYEASAEIIAKAQELAGHAGTTITITNDPVEAVQGANAIYTDVWTSMGSENEAAERRRAFAGYQVNEHLFTHAAAGAIFMHCLPAKRGEETDDALMESARSAVFDQAENRLHAQKALLLMLLRQETGQ